MRRFDNPPKPFAVPFLLVALLFLNQSSTVRAAAITTGGSGNWGGTAANAPWPTGVIPAVTDTITIASGHTVTLTDARTIAGVTINAGGTLVLGGNALTCNGNFTNNASGTFTANSGLLRFS